MKSLLFIVHGSRIPHRNEKLAALIENVGKKSNLLYKTAYLEGSKDTVERMTALLIEQGADELLILPVLILPALHALVDIPRKVESVVKNQSNLRAKFLKTFGDEPVILEILRERVEAAQALLPHARIVLLAHGTRHFAENEEILGQISKRLSDLTGERIEEVTYFGKKSFKSVLEKNRAENRPQVVIPFFIYNGRLVQKIKRQVEEIAPIPFTETLEIDSRIGQALFEIIQEEKTFDSPFTRLT